MVEYDKNFSAPTTESAPEETRQEQLKRVLGYLKKSTATAAPLGIPTSGDMADNLRNILRDDDDFPLDPLQFVPDADDFSMEALEQDLMDDVPAGRTTDTDKEIDF